MFLASISDDFFDLCAFDEELLYNKNNRPHLIILKLKYNNSRHDFAVPLRSNLQNHLPKSEYFSLPPRSTTKNNRIHAIHFLKMFPIKRIYLEKFNIEGNKHYKLIENVIKKNEKEIVEKAQKYLDKYQNGYKHRFATNIDRIYLTINA
nr:type III toxin-antitoxin system ToxN/AbiQ family toxin [Halanaerobium saccharolyticum]